ncbi:substrate-binding domain-containing protein [Dictyobacter formicarum]|uniref:DNA-binding transcriptional regulator CytR n=1 Tax=Dictyobacter formicarum TaxID=2778368 RepID=A0ABQ3VSY3_9CHLR|nr:GntR family transcriptional regulator [Dictyobacter formicarum]GHO89320.1 DNA-binding transcriptional regulator CytR [Dictyobacter formicarum]
MSSAQEQEPQLPLYRRIAQSIHQDIVQRSLVAHTKIPSEVELARQFGVSHGTITKALEALVRAGVLYRQRPQGTFVAEIAAPYETAAVAAQNSANTEEKRVEPSSVTFHVPSHTAFVGIVIPHLGTDFLDGMVLGVESMTRSFGYGLSFGYSEDDEGLERYHIEQFLRQNVAGMIIYPCDHRVIERDGGYISTPEGKDRIALLRTLQARQIPFVLLDRYVPEIEASYVVSDDFTAGYASTQHLIKLGHQRIGFVSVNYLVTSSAARRAGYLQCMRDHHLPVDEHLLLDSLLHAYPSAHNHYALVEECCSEDAQCLLAYLQHPQRPTALITMNDYLAVQVFCMLERTSLRVPEDLALVCSGGSNRLSSMMRVPLTTVVQPVGEIGRQSAYLLHNRISQRFSTNRQLKLPVSLLVRKSCGSTAHSIVQALPLPAER